MKKLLIISTLAGILLLASCEVEYRGDTAYYHHWGWEHQHYPNHVEVYNHGYHHDEHGNEVNHDAHPDNHVQHTDNHQAHPENHDEHH